jgi:hypothetical protein
VVLTGSHGGLNAGLQAAARGAIALIANDAGIGKQEAGIAGIRRLNHYGIAAAAVGHWSARIGDASDTLNSGLITYCNQLAVRAGVHAQMTAQDAAERLGASSSAHPIDMPLRAPIDRITLFAASGVPVTVVDSASAIDPSMCKHIVVTGSHGGLVGGNVIVEPVRAAFFNDAGLGKERSGIARVVALDNVKIPGLAVSYKTARIGDGRDSYRSGLVSVVNATAQDLGLRAGISVREAVELLAAPRLSD